VNAPLQAFEQAFAAALLDDVGATAASAWAKQPGFSVYRNTVRRACVGALRANYPTVEQLVGEAWFDAAAGIFVAAHPPRDAVLARYGEGFADFLATFAPARELAYLAGIARLDRCWTDSHLAADAPVLAASDLAAGTPDVLASLALVPHPAARWLGFATMPVYTIWRRHREALALDDELPWAGESALLTRPHGAVVWRAIDAAALAFLDASSGGAPFAVAVDLAAAANPRADLGEWLPALVGAGAFRHARPSDSRSTRA
jgi:hypothetical protein